MIASEQAQRSSLRVAFFMPTLHGGGAERVTLAQCAGLQDLGHDVELLVGRAEGSLAADLPPGLRVVDLGARRVLTAAGPLARHLRAHRPQVLISVLAHANVVAALTVLPLRRTKVIVAHHNTMSVSSRRSPRKRDRALPLLTGLAYRLADGILAVSGGVADDLAQATGIDRKRVAVLPNPIDYERIETLAQAPLPDGALPPGHGPLVLAAGRLTEQKNFSLLLRAVAALPADYRLVILGDGELRTQLQRLAADLDIADRVRFTGFTINPYQYFRAAEVYVLSSDWEGLPTVLLEALYFDLSIVATDCPSGPREILRDGADGTLVPVGDRGALAAAIAAARRPGPASADRWRPYDTRVVREQLAELIRAVAYGDDSRCADA